MAWTPASKLDAAIRGPIGPDLARPDTRYIQRPGWYQVITPSTKGPTQNEVLISELAEADADRVITETIAMYRAHGLPTKWCVGPWTRPTDFGERLTRRGFGHWDVRGMVLETDHSLVVPSDVVLEEITRANLAEYIDVFSAGWNMEAHQRQPLFDQHEVAISRTPRTAHFFLARVGGEPAGTTGLLLRDDFGYLVGAQILDRFRGRGLYRALIEARLAFLRARGRTLAVTHARESTSAPMLEHLGFESVFRSRCYLLEPTAPNAA